MKKILFLSIFFFGITNLFSQGPPMWSVNGNAANTSHFFGTTNSMPLILKTNNIERVKIDVGGNFRIHALAGAGNAVVIADANGILGRLNFPNNANTVLNGNSDFVSIQSISGWSTTANFILSDPGKKVGIGISNPTHKLDVLGNVNIDGLLKVDNIQIGDSSLHILSALDSITDPVSGNSIFSYKNEIYTDLNMFYGPDLGGVLFINCRTNSPNTVINNQTGRVIIGSPSTSIGGGSVHKFYVVGSQRVSKGTGLTSSFIDLVPSTTSTPTSVEIGSNTTTGQIDFKGVGNLSSDFKGRISYTDGAGFRIYTTLSSNPQVSILDNGKVTINSGINNNLVVEKNTTFPSGGMMIQSKNDLGLRSGELIFDAEQYKFLNGPVKIGNNISAINHWFPSCSTNCNYSLYVENGILTERVKVAVHTTGDWSDYTFADDYELLSLDSVENYIGKNKHLQGIPSSEEMVTNGNDLGLTDKLLLEKIENLYLYIIQLNKEVELLKAQNQQLIQQKNEKN